MGGGGGVLDDEGVMGKGEIIIGGEGDDFLGIKANKRRIKVLDIGDMTMDGKGFEFLEFTID